MVAYDIQFIAMGDKLKDSLTTAIKDGKGNSLAACSEILSFTI